MIYILENNYTNIDSPAGPAGVSNDRQQLEPDMNEDPAADPKQN
jgi:hypothetical protein